MESAREQLYQRRIVALQEEVTKLRLQNAELLKQRFVFEYVHYPPRRGVTRTEPGFGTK